MRPITYYKTFNIFIAIFVIFILFSLLSPRHHFLTPENLKIILVRISEFGIIVLGVGLLLTAGEFDLSIPSTLLFCSLIFLNLYKIRLDPSIAAFIVLLIGLTLGLINGLITTKGRIPSFITTLGTLLLWMGITNIFVPGGGERGVKNIPSIFKEVFAGEVSGIPVQFLWFIALTVVFGVLLHLHKFGYWIYATGDNKDAARAMGINTDLVKITCFMLVGLLSAFSAIMQMVRATAFFPGIGTGWNLQAIAACVIGGSSLFGGEGNILGIVLGSFAMIIIENGLIMLGISSTLAWLIYGLIILSFISLYMYLERLPFMKLRKA
jgi:ribose/xylose/arabinose/galactoside ABC-type transport system permease subunit